MSLLLIKYKQQGEVSDRCSYKALCAVCTIVLAMLMCVDFEYMKNGVQKLHKNRHTSDTLHLNSMSKWKDSEHAKKNSDY